MAEYDNIQLFSNYQSYHKNNNKLNNNGLASIIGWKRKKINHYDDNETMTALKCQRPNKITNRTTSTTTTINNDKHNVLSNSHHKQEYITYTDKCCKIKSIKSYCIDNNHNNDNDNNNYRHDNKFYRLPIRNYFSCYNKSKNSFKLALLLIIGLLFKINLCCGFVLDGSQNSYAQFRKWYTGLNGSLELEFKTEQPNGLLLYTDDGGTYDFFELKLVEGALRLRYNLGGGAQIITVGRDLHDGHWHKVQVSSTYIMLTFCLLHK